MASSISLIAQEEKTSLSLEWSKVYNDGENKEWISGVVPTYDGCYLVVGTEAPFPAPFKVPFIYCRAYPEKLPKPFYGHPQLDRYSIYDIAFKSLYLVGNYETISHIYVIKISEKGDKLWKRSFGEGNISTAIDVAPIGNGSGCLILGEYLGVTDEYVVNFSDDFSLHCPAYDYLSSTVLVTPFTNMDIEVISINCSGEETYSRLYGDNETDEKPLNIIPSSDGYVITYSTCNSPSIAFYYCGPHGYHPEDVYRYYVPATRSFGERHTMKIDDEFEMVSDEEVNWNVSLYACIHDCGIISYLYNYSTSIIYKTDENGTVKWSKTLPGKVIDDIINTPDGGFVIPLQGKITLAKIDSYGNIVWNKTYSRDKYGYDELVDVLQTRDRRYMLCGTCSTDTKNGTNIDIWMAKTNEHGDIVWNLSYGDENIDEYPECVVETSDGDFIVFGIANISISPSQENLTHQRCLFAMKFSKSKADETPGFDFLIIIVATIMLLVFRKRSRDI